MWVYALNGLFISVYTYFRHILKQLAHAFQQGYMQNKALIKKSADNTNSADDSHQQRNTNAQRVNQSFVLQKQSQVLRKVRYLN